VVATRASTSTTATYAAPRAQPGQSPIGLLVLTSGIVP
jgi:hypothetical protein